MLTGHWEVRQMWFIEYFRKTWLVNDWDGRGLRLSIPKKPSKRGGGRVTGNNYFYRERFTRGVMTV